MKLNFNSIKNDFFKEMKEQGEISNWQNISKLNIFDYADKFQEYVEKNYSEDDLKDNASLFKNLQGLKLNSTASSATIEGKEDDKFIVDFLNDMLKDDEFRNLLDENNDYKIDEEEMNAFLESIAGLDEEKENVSISDLSKGANKLKNGDLEYEVTRKNSDDLTKDEASEQSAPANSNQSPSNDNAGAGGSISPASNAGSASMGGSSQGNVATGNAINQNPTYNEDGTININNASYDELKEELSSAQGTFEEQQENLNAIQSESDPTIANAKEEVDNCYDAYEETVKEVNEDLANQLNEAKANLDEAKSAKDKQEGLITSQEATLDVCENNVKNANAKVEALSAQLSQLEANNDEDGKYDSKIASLKAEIESAKAEKEKAEQERDEAKNKLDEYKKELQETIEPNLEKAQEKFDEIQEKISNLEEENPEIAQAREAWEKAQADFAQTKEELTTQAKENIEASKNYVNEIQTRITEIETTKAIIANSLKGDSTPIELQEALNEFHTPEWWAENYGYNPETGELLGQSAKEIPFDSELMRKGIVGGNNSLHNCTGGVKHTIADAMKKELGIENKPINEYTPEEFDLVYPFGMPSEEKYNSSNTNYSERNFFSPAYQAADVLAGNENYREITNFNTSSLTYLPAGAVVVWPNGNGHQYGHISVADGQGHESSDFFGNQMTRYQNSVRVFLPV